MCESQDNVTEWYSLDDIELIEDESQREKLYCISVDSPDKQFLAGNIGVPTHNTDEGKEEDALKGEASMIIGSIARLGRAAGVHLCIATQRPDAKIIAGETKANLGVRINCGRTDSNASSMILGTSDGMRVKAFPRGRLYLRIYGEGNHGQGFFAEQNWIDEYLASKGKNPDGTPLSTKRSKLANVTDMSAFEGADLDAREGIDNASVIERIRQEESGENLESYSSDPMDDEETKALMDRIMNDDDDDSDDEDHDSYSPSAQGRPPQPSMDDDSSPITDYQPPRRPPIDDDEDDDSPISYGSSSYSDDDEDDALVEDDSEDNDGPTDRPKLTNGKDKENKWARPEDDWDKELDNLIQQNNS